MRKLKLKWTLNEANSFALIFGKILTKSVAELREDSALYLCAIVLLGLQKSLTDKILSAKMLFKPDVQITIKVEQALAIYTLVEMGQFDWFLQKDYSYEQNIMRDLFSVINQKFIA